MANNDDPQTAYARAYPSILAAALKHKQVPAARLWLLLQASDPAGRGVFDVDQVRAQFSDKKSPSHICGERNLRKNIADGEGIFWRQHTAGRLWLNSPARVAIALGVKGLCGDPVALPVVDLLGGMHKVKSAFSAAWHAGRGNADPISRDALKGILGVGKSTQRTYDKTANIARRRNIGILGDCTKEAMQDAAWRYGRAAFKFCDHAGKLGKPGYVYAAVGMPTSYIAELAKLPTGRKRKNNKLINLVTNAARGKYEQGKRVYHADGDTAADAYNRDPEHDHFYKRGPALVPTAATRSKLAGADLWSMIQGQR